MTVWGKQKESRADCYGMAKHEYWDAGRGLRIAVDSFAASLFQSHSTFLIANGQNMH